MFVLMEMLVTAVVFCGMICGLMGIVIWQHFKDKYRRQRQEEADIYYTLHV